MSPMHSICSNSRCKCRTVRRSPFGSGPAAVLALLVALHFSSFFIRPAAATASAAQVAAAGALLLQPTESQYSVHACPGMPYRHYSIEHMLQSCRFHHVCLDHATKEIVYFMNPGAQSFFVDRWGEHHDEVPDDWLAADSIASWMPKVYDPKGIMQYFKPKIERGAIPPTAVYVNYTESPVHVLLAPRGPLHNFGHALYDVLQSVFNLLYNFKMYTPNFRVLFYPEAAGMMMGENTGAFLTGPPETNLLRLISNHEAIAYSDVASQQEGATHTCFHTLLVGARLHNPYNTIQGFSSADMRAAVVQNLGLSHVELEVKEARILVLDKKGRRRVINMASVVEAIRAALPDVHLEVMDSHELGAMPLRDQVELMSKTAVFLGPPGGAMAIAVFMAPGSALVTLNGCFEQPGLYNKMMDGETIAKWTHLLVDSVPATLEDLDNPGAQTCLRFEEEGHKNCDYMLRPNTVQQVVSSVQRGVAMWRMHHASRLAALGTADPEPGS